MAVICMEACSLGAAASSAVTLFARSIILLKGHMTKEPDPTAERRDEVVKRMLATPPQKHTPKKKGADPKADPKET